MYVLSERWLTHLIKQNKIDPIIHNVNCFGGGGTATAAVRRWVGVVVAVETSCLQANKVRPRENFS